MNRFWFGLVLIALISPDAHAQQRLPRPQFLLRYAGTLTLGSDPADLSLPPRLVDAFYANINPILLVPIRDALQMIAIPSLPAVQEPELVVQTTRPIIGGPVVALPVARSIFGPHQPASISFANVAPPSTFMSAEHSLLGSPVQIEVTPQAPSHANPR
jgi:hypothetical protein